MLAKLIAADTTNPPGNETRAVKIVADFLRELQIKYHIHGKEKRRENILWTLGSGPKEIFIAAHTDVVPIGGKWKTNPMKLVPRSGNFIGRGVVDNKGVLAALLVATKILQPIESRLSHRIVFAAVADEEMGSEFGMKYLLEKKIVRPSVAIIPDSCGENHRVIIAEKGALHLKIKAFGKQGHGSMPESSINAIFVLKDFLCRVQKMKFTKKGQWLTATTISVGAFHAGTVANIIPAEAELLLDIRYPPTESKARILQRIKTIADTEARRWKTQPFQIEILVDMPASETDSKHPLVYATVNAIKKITGKKPRVVGMPGFTVAGFLRSQKIPTVSFGPGKPQECHRVNEKVAERELFEFVKIVVELLKIF